MKTFKQYALWFGTLFLGLSLSGCQSMADQAIKSFEQGDYVGSVSQYAAYATDRGEQIADKNRQQFQNIVNQSVGHYEAALNQAAPKDHAARIAPLLALKNMRLSLYAPIHRQLVPEVVQRLDLDRLTQELASQYYQLGHSITGKQREDYRRRAEAYRNALQQVSPYQDSQALLTLNDKTYKGLVAEDHYQAGLTLAKSKDYRAAAASLGQIAAIYAPYGDYKNTAALLTQYESIWRTAEYTVLLQQARTAAGRIQSKRSARDAAALYQSAANTLSRYGDSSIAQQKANKYQQQGLIHLFVDDDSRPLMHSGLTSSADSALSSSKLTPFLRLTKDRKEADIVVRIRIKESYERDDDSVERTAQSLQVRDGNKTTTHPNGAVTTEPHYVTKRFTKITTSAENRYLTKVELAFSGLYQEKLTHTFAASSQKQEVHYEGDVPSGKAYHKKKNSSLKRKDDLAKDSRQQASNDLHNRLTRIASTFDTL